MDSKSLMIGDWVTFKDCQYENPILIKIVGIGYQGSDGEENECLVQINGDKACDIIDIDDEIVGIPLTAEILEKNGFIKRRSYSDYRWYLDGNNAVTLNIYSESNKIWRMSIDTNRNENTIVYVTFVHQLQNALRLCGIEKEIEL